MITFEEASEFITATHLYAGLTQDEVDAVKMAKYVTTINGELILGTDEPVENFVELLPTA